MKQLNSYALAEIDGGKKVSYAYDVLDDATGMPLKQNIMENFTVLDDILAVEFQSIWSFIQSNKLTSNDVLKLVIVTSVGGGDRITYVYDALDNDGNLQNENGHGKFYAVNQELISVISKIKAYIRTNILEG